MQTTVELSSINLFAVSFLTCPVWVSNPSLWHGRQGRCHRATKSAGVFVEVSSDNQVQNEGGDGARQRQGEFSQSLTLAWERGREWRGLQAVAGVQQVKAGRRGRSAAER